MGNCSLFFVNKLQKLHLMEKILAIECQCSEELPSLNPINDFFFWVQQLHGSLVIHYIYKATDYGRRILEHDTLSD